MNFSLGSRVGFQSDPLKVEQEIKVIGECEGRFVVLMRCLYLHCSQRGVFRMQLICFFSRGRNKCLDVHLSAQSYFNLPRRTLGTNCNIIVFFIQILKDLKNIYSVESLPDLI